MSYTGGLLLGCFTTALSAAGLTLQKLGHLRLERERELQIAALGTSSLRSYDSLHWRLGLCCLVASALLSLAVTALLGQALASTLAALTILWSALFARAFLHEHLGRIDAVALSLLISGAVLALVFGRSPEGSENFLSPQDVRARLVRPLPIALGVCIATLQAAFLLFIAVIESARLKHRSGGTSPSAARATPPPAAGQGLARPPPPVPARLLRAALFARVACAGIFSAWTGLCSKGFSSQIGYSTQSSANLAAVTSSIGFYALLAGLIASVLLQTGELSAALRYGDASIVVPAYQALIVLLGVLWGLSFWGERPPTSEALTFFILGLLLILAGLTALSFKQRPPSPALAAAAALHALVAEHGPPHRRSFSATAALGAYAAAAATAAASGDSMVARINVDVGGDSCKEGSGAEEDGDESCTGAHCRRSTAEAGVEAVTASVAAPTPRVDTPSLPASGSAPSTLTGLRRRWGKQPLPKLETTSAGEMQTSVHHAPLEGTSRSSTTTARRASLSGVHLVALHRPRGSTPRVLSVFSTPEGERQGTQVSLATSTTFSRSNNGGIGHTPSHTELPRYARHASSPVPHASVLFAAPQQVAPLRDGGIIDTLPPAHQLQVRLSISPSARSLPPTGRRFRRTLAAAEWAHVAPQGRGRGRGATAAGGVETSSGGSATTTRPQGNAEGEAPSPPRRRRVHISAALVRELSLSPPILAAVTVAASHDWGTTTRVLGGGRGHTLMVVTAEVATAP